MKHLESKKEWQSIAVSETILTPADTGLSTHYEANMKWRKSKTPIRSVWEPLF